MNIGLCFVLVIFLSEVLHVNARCPLADKLREQSVAPPSYIRLCWVLDIDLITCCRMITWNLIPLAVSDGIAEQWNSGTGQCTITILTSTDIVQLMMKQRLEYPRPMGIALVTSDQLAYIVSTVHILRMERCIA